MRFLKALLLTLLFVGPLSFAFSMLTASQAVACGGPCPEPEPEPKPEPPKPEPPSVDHDRDPPIVVKGPCYPYPADRLKSDVSVEDLKHAYLTAAKKGQWAQVWVRGGRIIALNIVGEPKPEGAFMRQLVKLPFEDGRACGKIGGGLLMHGVEFETD